MPTQEEQLIKTLQAHVRLLIERYRKVVAENEELYGMVDEKEKTIESLQKEKEGLARQYQNLKLAKMIEIGDNDMKNAKNRLSKLVRDVDKCIALLKV
ncbi:MAG: hypothetical protein J6B92_08835 [Paraprevotella sp.]|jgi:hypothetical protein|nr:hypothetical protein [Paraprevotella sp.]MBP3471304.1 hypothetical protein [Paraprevotella sp.]